MKRAGEAGIALRASGVKAISDQPPAARHGDLSQYSSINAVLEFDVIVALRDAYRTDIFS
jgi:hypothetical protein